MINKIKSMFGMQPKVDISGLIKNGAVIVDVRTKDEFSGGHAWGSINIPLNSLAKNLNKFKDKDAPIITCCASGMRSASARGLLKNAGYTNVYNGGSWVSVRNKIS